MIKILKKFLCIDNKGATAIEYGLIMTGIGMVIIGIVFSIGGDFSNFFSSINDRIEQRINERDLE